MKNLCICQVWYHNIITSSTRDINTRKHNKTSMCNRYSQRQVIFLFVFASFLNSIIIISFLKKKKIQKIKEKFIWKKRAVRWRAFSPSHSLTQFVSSFFPYLIIHLPRAYVYKDPNNKERNKNLNHFVIDNLWLSRLNDFFFIFPQHLIFLIFYIFCNDIGLPCHHHS